MMLGVNDFVSALGKDDTLAHQLLAAIGVSEGKPAYEAVSRFAQSNGYAVSVDEARLAHTAYVDSLASDDISDDELEGVSGGMFQPSEVEFAHQVLKTIFKGW